MSYRPIGPSLSNCYSSYSSVFLQFSRNLTHMFYVPTCTNCGTDLWNVAFKIFGEIKKVSCRYCIYSFSQIFAKLGTNYLCINTEKLEQIFESFAFKIFGKFFKFYISRVVQQQQSCQLTGLFSSLYNITERPYTKKYI